MAANPIGKHWNTWSGKSYAAMQFLPAAFSIIPGAYCSNTGTFSDFPVGPQTRLYEHSIDGTYCRLTVEHEEAIFEIEYFKPDGWTVAGKITNRKPPKEWGFGYNILLTLGFSGEGRMVKDDSGGLYGATGSYEMAAVFKQQPYDIVLAEDPCFAGKFLEQYGYMAPGPEAEEEPSWASCKFQLESSPVIEFAVSAANSRAEAREKAGAGLLLLPELDQKKEEILREMPRSKTEQFSGSLEAIRDIMAWNNMARPDDRKLFTSITKLWNDNMGGWYFFYSDLAYNMLFNSIIGDWDMAARNLDMVLSASTPQGNFAGFMSGYQEWVDRSQPPVLSFCLLLHYMISGDLVALQKAFPALIAANRWHILYRDKNKNGLVELGTSGNGHGYFTGQRMAAKDEASMDNSPMYDQAHFNEELGVLEMDDVGISALHLLDTECLEKIALLLGKKREAGEMAQKRAALKKALNLYLWDSERKLYANRHFDGRFGVASPTSFYPLAAGAADEEQLKRSIEHIFDPAAFWTECPMPAIHAGDPSIHENRYWRGRTWAPQSFWTYLGLRRYGKDAEAHRLAEGAVRYFDKHWKAERRSYENYNPFTGEGADSVDSDFFYSWTALLPLIWLMEHVSIDPWNGLCFGAFDGKPFAVENLCLRQGLCAISYDGKESKVSRNGRAIFSSNLPGRFKHFVFEEHYASVTVHNGSKDNGYLCFNGITPLKVTLNGRDLDDAVEKIRLPQGSCKVEVYF